MDIKLIKFEKLKPLREKIILKLGWIEASINYYKKFKTNTKAQAYIIKLKDEKKHFNNIKEQINKRLKQDW